MRVGFSLVLLLCASAALMPSRAITCGCAAPDDWSIERARSEGAVFAEVVPAGERLQPIEGGSALRIYTAAVRRAIGLKPGGMIRIVTAADEAACGVALEGSEPRWLQLHQQPEGWGADLCAQQPLESVPAEEWDRRAGPAPE